MPTHVPTTNADAKSVQGVPVLPTAPTDGDVYVYSAADGAWKPGPVTATDIADGSITTAKIAAAAVTLAKLTAGLQRGIPSRTVASGTAITIVAGDMGGVVHAAGTGGGAAQPISLTTMVAVLVAGFDLVLNIAQDASDTAAVITPGTGVSIDGVGSGTPTTLAAGYGLRTLVSSDGLNWLTKAV